MSRNTVKKRAALYTTNLIEGIRVPEWPSRTQGLERKRVQLTPGSKYPLPQQVYWSASRTDHNKKPYDAGGTIMPSRSPILWIRNPLACSDAQPAGGVLVQDSRIIEKVAAGQQPKQAYDQSWDASRHVLLPGLVNTHHHFYQTLTRAYTPALNKPLFP